MCVWHVWMGCVKVSSYLAQRGPEDIAKLLIDPSSLYLQQRCMEANISYVCVLFMLRADP